jgi:hypothetical protein
MNGAQPIAQTGHGGGGRVRIELVAIRQFKWIIPHQLVRSLVRSNVRSNLAAFAGGKTIELFESTFYGG